jgi:hypothetical protein
MILNQTDQPIKASGTSDSSHWYAFENGIWSPLYTPEKNYTLREARKDKEAGRIVVPSVTTIFKVLAKPQLVKWQMEQVALACWNSGIAPGIGKEDFIEQTVDTANNASKGAMDLGTRIHQSIEDCLAGRDYDADLKLYVSAVMAKRAEMGIRWSVVEECVGSTKYGYAGRGDDRTDETKTLRDYKSRKSNGKKVAVYETDFVQLSAYMFAAWGNEAFRSGTAELWGISTTEPGLLTVTTKTGPELVPYFECFLSLCNVWRHMNSFDARVAA